MEASLTSSLSKLDVEDRTVTYEEFGARIMSLAAAAASDSKRDTFEGHLTAFIFF